jgi:hypothetical protein
MSMIRLFGIAIGIVTVVGAFVTATAGATEPGKWLFNGAEVTSSLAFTVESELLLENVLNSGAVLCSVIFAGKIGPGGESEITKILNLSGVELTELDPGVVGTGIKCTGEKLCNSNSEIWPGWLVWLWYLVWDPVLLSWRWVAVIHELHLPWFYIHCVSLISVNELCTVAAESSIELLNSVSDVEGSGALTPLGECGGSSEDELIEVEALLITTPEGGTLSASL